MNDPSSPYNAVYRMGAGAFAGMFATILTHPMDVIRAKLTIQSQTTKVYKGVYCLFEYSIEPLFQIAT